MLKKYGNRDSNIELLRIVLILMVITLHYCNSAMGGLLPNTHVLQNKIIGNIAESVSIIAVNVFILITGYYSYNKNSVKLKKIINLWMITILYGLVLTIIGLSIEKQYSVAIFIDLIVNSVLNQWFVVIYSILYLTIPFLNKLLDNLNRKQIQIFLSINILFFYFWPTFINKVSVNDSGYGITNFVTLYIIGFYIRKYGSFVKRKSLNIIIYLLSSFITAVIGFLFGRGYAYNSIFVLIACVEFFEFFKSIHLSTNNFINYLATFTFAIYLIDVNGPFTIFLYRKLFKTPKFWNSNFLIVHIIITVLGIYIICVVIEALRRLIFKPLFDTILNKVKWKIKVK